MISVGHMQLPGYTRIRENPLPVLRDQSQDRVTEVDGSMPKDKQAAFGKYAGFRVLPYKMQSHYERSKDLCTLKTVILENESLKAVFLPEYGGRLYSLYHKGYERELLSVNPVFQPANLGLRNAWFSGGIEWNMAHFGHTYLSCAPVFFASCVDDSGHEFLRMYEYERVKKLFYQIDFHLTNQETLVAYTKIINIYPEKTPLYYWSNTAVSELHRARVFSEANEVIYVKPYLNDKGLMTNVMGYGQLPYLEGIEGDVSYPRQFQRSNEYFYQNPESLQHPYEAVAYEDGSLFYECSSNLLRYRKMFCWGTHAGGDRWQEYLSHGHDDRYVEIQAGIFPSQLHSELMEGQSSLEFMQMFGMIEEGDLERLYDDDYNQAKAYVKEEIFSRHNHDQLEAYEKAYSRMSKLEPRELLSYGTGWGALEKERLGCSSVPDEEGSIIRELASMSFPQDSLTHDQEFWLGLLRGQASINPNQEMTYMVDPYWLPYLDKALDQLKNISSNQGEASLDRLVLEKALILSENFRIDEAIDLLVNMRRPESSLVYVRTIGALYDKKGYSDQALKYYEEAFALIDSCQTPYMKEDFMVEWIELLTDRRSYEKIWSLYESLQEKGIEETEEIQVSIGEAAYHLKKWSYLEGLFNLEPARIREGNNQLCELWFKKKAYDLGETDLDKVRARFNPPENIDFRML